MYKTNPRSSPDKTSATKRNSKDLKLRRYLETGRCQETDDY